MTGHPDHHAALLARTPAAARRVVYVGSGAAAFWAAHAARNPHAQAVVADAEALVVEDLTAFLDEPGQFAAVAADGVVAGFIPPTDEAGVRRAGEALAQAGFEVLQLQPPARDEHFDDELTDLAPGLTGGALPAGAAARGLLVTARRARPDAPAPLRLFSVVFAPRLMDIRTRLPSHALRTEPELTVAFRAAPFPIPPAPPEQPKVQILQRPAQRDLAVWRSSMLTNIRDGWIVILEYDDHPVLVAEVTGRVMGPGDWLRFGCVHAVQTSTPQLAAELAAYNPETRVFANSVFELAPFPEKRPRRVFYGGVSRGAFAVDTARALAPATAEFPDAEFLVVGDRAVFDALPTANKRFFDFLPYDDYLALMGTCSISLSPIEGRRHQETKSDAKFLDASSRGALTIASPTIYADTIRDGETGLIARSQEDWPRLLAHVLRHEHERRRMARAAWEYVRDHRMFADQVRTRRDWYRDLWGRREALNAAVVERLGQLPIP